MKLPPHGVSVLVVRLVGWFILLSSLPILVLIFFVRQNAQATLVNLENSRHYEMAGILAGQAALSDNIQDVQRMLSMLEGGDQIAFILSRDGTYLAHVDGSKINTKAEDDFSPDSVRTILTERDGLYSEWSNPYVFAFAPVPGQDDVVVVAGEVSTISAVMRELERDSYLELLISMAILLISFLAGFQVMTMQNKSLKEEQRLAELNQKSRASFDILMRDIRMSGYKILESDFLNYLNI